MIAPSPRSARNQEKFLQNQVQKLTLDLKKQKEQAQLVRGRRDQGVGEGTQAGVRGKAQVGVGLGGSAAGEDPAHLCTLREQEKTQLEERLLQTATTMQQLEAELQAFQKSCLLQLARSSWVGRILRSSTGSVEVRPARPTHSPPAFSSPALLGWPLGHCLSCRSFGGAGLPGKPVSPQDHGAGRNPLVPPT